MARGVKKQTFVWDFDSPVEAIWPILADTQRLNEAANFPKHAIEEIVQPDGGVTFVATARLGSGPTPGSGTTNRRTGWRVNGSAIAVTCATVP